MRSVRYDQTRVVFSVWKPVSEFKDEEIVTVSSHLFWKLRDINVINADNFSGNFLAILSLSLETDFLSTLTFLRIARYNLALYNMQLQVINKKKIKIVFSYNTEFIPHN